MQWQIHVHLSPNTMFQLASFKLSMYRKIVTERNCEISNLSNMKMFFNYNASDRRDAVISRSRRISNVRTILFPLGFTDVVPFHIIK